MLNGYLRTTDDEYMLVKLDGKAAAVLEGRESVWMKMSREQQRTPKTEQEGKDSKKIRKNKAAGQLELDEQGENLFEKLRKLRMEIAREEKVPPYIVFSDKTLVHMALLKPQSKEEMLRVSGVGEFKYKKYGERFVECVRRQCQEVDEENT